MTAPLSVADSVAVESGRWRWRRLLTLHGTTNTLTGVILPRCLAAGGHMSPLPAPPRPALCPSVGPEAQRQRRGTETAAPQRTAELAYRWVGVGWTRLALLPTCFYLRLILQPFCSYLDCQRLPLVYKLTK